MLALRLPEELEQRLEKLAAATGRSKSYYARLALEEYLEDLEDFYLAEKRYADRSDDAIPLEEVMKRYGLDA